MTTKTWTFLKPQDAVDIIAPASHSPLINLEEGIKWLESVGLKTNVPENLIKPDLFFASTLETQLEHLKAALKSDSKVIWCMRGGYGSMRLIPHLKKIKPPKKPKLLIGFSDITSLHLYFSQEWGWPTLHGRNISGMNLLHADVPDRIFMKELLFGKKTEKTFKRLIPLNQHARSKGLIKGTITGGNLRIVQSSLKTEWELEAKRKILFLEDVGERGYSIDRMLEQMIQARMIHRGLKAVVFGDFTEGLEKDGRDLAPDALQRFADKVPYPVFKSLPSGHGADNWPIPFNTSCALKLGSSGELSCSYGGRA